MADLERDLERLFATDARARTVRSITVTPARGPSLLTFAIAGALAGLLMFAAFAALRGPSGRVASPPVLASAPPSVTPSATASPSCMDPLRKDPGQSIVGGAKLPGGAALEIARVTTSTSEARWPVLFVVGEGGSALDVAPRATLRGPDGVVPVLGYEAGPDELHTTPTTAALRVLPCQAAMLLVRTAAVRSGEFTLTLESVTSSGATTAVPIFAPLTCATTPAGAVECTNTRGTRSTPVPTASN